MLQTLEELNVPYEFKVCVLSRSDIQPHAFSHMDIVARVTWFVQECSLTAKEAWFTEAYHQALGHEAASDGKVPIIKVSRYPSTLPLSVSPTPGRRAATCVLGCRTATLF
jgi:hypothetical protein